jgi:hypothetical protein
MSHATRQAVVMAIRAMAACEQMHTLVRNLTPAEQKERNCSIYEADHMVKEAEENLMEALTHFERSIGND